jgi:hypothetical protein
VPPALRRDIERLRASLSPSTQLATLLPLVDELHDAHLPLLRTQPEWQRRPTPGADQPSVAARQAAAAGLEPGSLEALVVEATVEELTERLFELGDALAGHGPHVTVARPLSEHPFGGWARELVWRVSRIDWHLTFFDTGLAACWDTEDDEAHDVRRAHVPWVVALAIEATTRAGLVSALYSTAAAPFDPDPPSA